VWLRLRGTSVIIVRLSSQLPPLNYCRVLAGLVEQRLEPNSRAQVEPRGLLDFFERRERCHLYPFHAQKVAFLASQPLANKREAHRPFNPENGRKFQYFSVLSRREGILECPHYSANRRGREERREKGGPGGEPAHGASFSRFVARLCHICCHLSRKSG